jgi:hypothetical protein
MPSQAVWSLSDVSGFPNCARHVVGVGDIGWTGCKSSLESLPFDLPIVTLTGPLMRGRHSTAILGLMGVTETIATPLSRAALGYVFSDTLVVFDVNARVKADGPCVLAGQ